MERISVPSYSELCYWKFQFSLFIIKMAHCNRKKKECKIINHYLISEKYESFSLMCCDKTSGSGCCRTSLSLVRLCDCLRFTDDPQASVSFELSRNWSRAVLWLYLIDFLQLCSFQSKKTKTKLQLISIQISITSMTINSWEGPERNGNIVLWNFFWFSKSFFSVENQWNLSDFFEEYKTI